MFVQYNANPLCRRGTDCTIRAISKATGQSWEDVYMDVCLEGLKMYDMPSANHVWGSYLSKRGFKMYAVPNSCPDCYSVEEFCSDHPCGSYVVGVQNHVIAVVDGNYFDTWDSGLEVPYYYWQKED